MIDPISDMATRIRNAIAVEAIAVDVPVSKLKIQIAACLQREGFIWDYESISEKQDGMPLFRINLKYGPSGERVLNSIRRISKPGKRVYFGATDTPKVLNGLGVIVLSTNKGVLSSRETRDQQVGGEALIEVW